MATELAVAYVSLVPSARGISQSIHNELAGPTNAAAQSAGAAAGREFGTRFSGSLNNIVVPRELERSFTRVGTSATNTGESFKRVGTGARQAVRSARGLGNTLTGLQDTSQGVSQIMQGDLLGGLISLHSGFIDLAAGVAKTATTIGKAAVSIVVSIAKTVAANAAAVASTVAGWVVMGVQALLGAAKIALAWLISLGPIAIVIAVVAGVVALIIMYWDEIKEAIVAAATFVLNFLRDHWPIILIILTGPIGAAIALIVTHWDTIKSVFSAAVGFVIDFVQEHWPLILAILTGPIGLAVLFITQNWDTIVGIFRTTVEFILGIWQAGWDAVWAIVQVAWQTLSGFFTALPGAIAGFFADAINWLVEGGRNILRGLSNGILEIWASVTAWFGTIGGTLVGYFWNALTWLVQSGKDIITGMWDGIKAIWSDVVNWFQDLPNKVLDALGIASPPQWAIDAGRFILEGITKGLGLGAGNVMDFMAGIADKFTGPLKAAWNSVTGFISGIWDSLFGGGPSFGALKDIAASGIQGLAQTMAAAYGWTGAQWDALRTLVQNESGWRPNAQNPTSTAYGLFQFLDSTWASVGARKTSDPAGQIAAGLEYIRRRYQTPLRALQAWQSRSPHWYATGGVLPYTGVFGGHRGEAVFNRDQLRVLGSLGDLIRSDDLVSRRSDSQPVVNQNFYGVTDAGEITRRGTEEWAWTMRVLG